MQEIFDKTVDLYGWLFNLSKRQIILEELYRLPNLSAYILNVVEPTWFPYNPVE